MVNLMLIGENCIHKVCESIAKILPKISLLEKIITGEWGSIRKFAVPSPPPIKVALYYISMIHLMEKGCYKPYF